MTRLNSRQEAFCQEYVIRKDAKASAIAAGYSESRAKQTGFELLQYDHIISEIARLQAIRDVEFGMTAADVLREIVIVALADIGQMLTWGMEEVFDEGGLPLTLPNGKPVMRPVCHPISSQQMTEYERRAIKSVSVSKDGTFKFELHDRMKGLELLGRHLGLFDKDNKQKGEASANNALAALVAAAQGTPLMPNAMTYDN
ncbi:terminase small subunit [Paracoccus sp. PAMC 22219]|uniref:terminase small subunit n=1 Tax=Paracoccus sp. PAMC 22219 TaxID=1569209 RepID=UPI0005A990C3|nr:terminase small subunit [Paracoccus sp. PAMC 22219]